MRVTTQREIILVINSLNSGGAEKQLLWIARNLAAEGIACSVAELRANPGNQRLQEFITQTAAAGVQFSRAHPGTSYFGAFVRVSKLIRDNPRAIVWTWGARSDGMMLLLSFGGLRRRWISSLRSANKQVIRRQRFFLRLCDKFITHYVSNSLLNCALIEEICPGAASRCTLLNNVVEELVDPPLVLEPTRAPMPLRLMMLGNIDPHVKGYDLALTLAEQFRDTRMPVEIHIAGRPDTYNWLQTEIERRKLTREVIYIGETGRPIAFLRTGHAYLLFSRLEGTPNALLEAMSVGLPAIATKVGDLEFRTQDREQLRLIPVADVAAAHAAVKELLDDWPEAVAMGRRGRAWCEKQFNADSCRRSLSDTISKILL